MQENIQQESTSPMKNEPTLSLDDLKVAFLVMVNSVQRGAILPEEMKVVGIAYERFKLFIDTYCPNNPEEIKENEK